MLMARKQAVSEKADAAASSAGQVIMAMQLPLLFWMQLPSPHQATVVPFPSTAPRPVVRAVYCSVLSFLCMCVCVPGALG